MSSEQEGEERYIKTTTHNFISRNAVIEGPRQVEIKGRSIIQDGVKIRGDLGIVRVGRYVWIEEGTELEPAPMVNATTVGGGGGAGETNTTSKHVPMMIGNHTRIGGKCRIQAAAVGSMVFIGDNVTIGKRCIIKDCCVIDPNVTLGDDTVVPPFTRIAHDGKKVIMSSKTNNLKMVQLPPSMSVESQEKSMDQYHEFINLQRVRK